MSTDSKNSLEGNYRTFSIALSAATELKKKETSLLPAGVVWYTNMAAVTSCKNAGRANQQSKQNMQRVTGAKGGKQRREKYIT